LTIPNICGFILTKFLILLMGFRKHSAALCAEMSDKHS
jgi:hypothetical protein